MSRIGKQPIEIPAGVTITVDDANHTIKVKGAKGELEQQYHADMTVKQEDGQLIVERPTEQKRHRAMHGLYRSLIQNMVTGVTEGYKKQLELVGVGYKAVANGQVLDLSLGYSHNILMQVPPEVTVSAETPKGKAPIITLESADKQLIGHVAAKLRALRKIEPYKGKGVRFLGEQVRRKAGKSASK
ncbi:MAG: 50S ribosomal protein L6 [Bernardetiaceae bacterium]|nr:50S ribosomal protein L6 [Bernardetiaceae bacterium]